MSARLTHSPAPGDFPIDLALDRAARLRDVLLRIEQARAERFDEALEGADMDGLWNALAEAERRCNVEIDAVMKAIRAYQCGEDAVDLVSGLDRAIDRVDRISQTVADLKAVGGLKA